MPIQDVLGTRSIKQTDHLECKVCAQAHNSVEACLRRQSSPRSDATTAPIPPSGAELTNIFVDGAPENPCSLFPRPATLRKGSHMREEQVEIRRNTYLLLRRVLWSAARRRGKT
ncbi:hypothetical protein FA13DRAFT_242324 [Coprinellus micaceus]|uniref:Uncharacterized protein n=1 Tax=Coprinellus micaceus TaxID=71717 RepID=A0A4Y7SGW7_COPMI|nr:hypothetical protein FA13DRAFT_242324 [Coprinellus micaceus]